MDLLEKVGFCVAPSLLESNTYFIFRDNGIEIKVKIEGFKIIGSRDLTMKELKYLRVNNL